MSPLRAHGVPFSETMPSDLDSAIEAERLLGPLHGYYIACYSVHSDDGFYAYAKAYTEPLTCVWNTPSPVAKYAAGPFETGEFALHAVVQKCDQDLRQRVSKATRLMRWLLRSVGRDPDAT